MLFAMTNFNFSEIPILLFLKMQILLKYEENIVAFEKIVVTGIGAVTALGIGCDNLWDSLLKGKSAIKRINFEDADMDQFTSQMAAPIENFDVSDFFEKDKSLKRNGRVTNFAIAGTKLALEDAGFKFQTRKTDSGKISYVITGIDSFRAGVVMGVGVHNMDISEKFHALHVLNNGPKKTSPFALPFIPTNAVPAMVAEKFNIIGPSYAVSTACASGTHAIINAYNLLQSPDIDMVITGGCDACITSYVYGGFDAMLAMSKNNDIPDKACRPFDKNRDGFIIGEGSGILILEKESTALKRGAKIIAELAGGCMSSDAYHITIPEPTGASAIKMLNRVFEVCCVAKDEVGYINAHGTSTPLNDSTESHVIKQVFGQRAYKIPVSSTKSMLGHSIGASGGIEAIVCIKTIISSMIHPTRNLEYPDIDYVDPRCPELDKRCDLDYVPGLPREQNVDVALSQSFGFGGHNSAVVFKKYF